MTLACAADHSAAGYGEHDSLGVPGRPQPGAIELDEPHPFPAENHLCPRTDQSLLAVAVAPRQRSNQPLGLANAMPGLGRERQVSLVPRGG